MLHASSDATDSDGKSRAQPFAGLKRLFPPGVVQKLIS
jgi:hypothetical protein